eukprot:c8737_g1_i1.p1 GENE.c8737_g1_i1~~c8737_g1_i1.p1  ORF type:complete len:218 (+),score=29.54 c8737_g1_i1:345-998(+)
MEPESLYNGSLRLHARFHSFHFPQSAFFVVKFSLFGQQRALILVFEQLMKLVCQGFTRRCWNQFVISLLEQALLSRSLFTNRFAKVLGQVRALAESKHNATTVTTCELEATSRLVQTDMAQICKTVAKSVQRSSVQPIVGAPARTGSPLLRCEQLRHECVHLKSNLNQLTNLIFFSFRQISMGVTRAATAQSAERMRSALEKILVLAQDLETKSLSK